MEFAALMRRVNEAQQVMTRIAPGVNASVVAVFGLRQFSVDQIAPYNAGLFKHCDIFEPGQPRVAEAEKVYAEYARLENELKKQKKAAPTAASLKKLAKKERACAAKIARLREILLTAVFKTPQFELRFAELDMNAIQKIKNHPIVQKIGKTDGSRASIRVVIG